ncbi:hypothetical protein C380_18275 [Acidovorax sp. KKS102]|uniref:hypothetical protein n=1 Tax=Acidovorax sp. KKS102 TaxID=358220 RepID=UPI00028BBD7A|nr:hypothetical protein [Acidovorax sp. KKS102]AFU47349.1 hypothetical protein C380_18275 [Acidovorax sp. KKS102]
MSKANGKSTNTTAEEAAAPTASAAADTGAIAVVQPAPAAKSAPDRYHGHGGLYRMTNGRRVQVEQTQPETTKERK